MTPYHQFKKSQHKLISIYFSRSQIYFELTDINKTPTDIQFQARYKRRKNKSRKDMSLSRQIYREKYISYQLYLAKFLKEVLNSA